MDTLRDENSTTVRSETNSHVDASAPILSSAPPVAGAASRPAQASWVGGDWWFPLLRTGMRTLSRLAPPLAVALFDRIWFSAPRTTPRPEPAAWLARGEPMPFHLHGHRVNAWSWGRGPTVLLVHGWGGNAGQMHALIGPLLERGLRVVAFDAPAHGTSDPSRLGGRRVSMIEIADALRVVAAGVGPIAGLVAHSGGCTATALALRDGWAGPERIAFVAPFALPSEAIAPFGRAIGASVAVTARFRALVEHRFARPWTDFDMPGLAARRGLPPLLVVHDRDDCEVPFFHGQAVAEAWPQARLAETGGLGHRRLLRDPSVVADIVAFTASGQPDPGRATPADARGELDRAYAAAGLDCGKPMVA